MLDIESYLERINYIGSTAPNAQTLRALQTAHLVAVPFENLSIHAKEPIVLEDGALFEKVVERRRGGFCYELNGLFGALLRSMGFEVAMLSARVANQDGSYSRDFDHMTLMVSLEERWLVDVGFGDAFREPLMLDSRKMQRQVDRDCKLVSESEDLVLMERRVNDAWRIQYRFSTRKYQYADFAEMCQFHQSSPESHFTKKRVCTRATPNGRITLSEKRFILTTLGGEREERSVADREQYLRILGDEFGVLRIA